MNIFFNVGNAVGMLTGGVLGDLFAKRSPRYARPFVNQLSMIIIAPLFFILYKALPGEPQHPACAQAVRPAACRLRDLQCAHPAVMNQIEAQPSACRGIIYRPTSLALLSRPFADLYRQPCNGASSVPSATCVFLGCRILELHGWSARPPARQPPVLLRPAVLHDHRRTLGASQQRGHVCRGAACTGLTWHLPHVSISVTHAALQAFITIVYISGRRPLRICRGGCRD